MIALIFAFIAFISAQKHCVGSCQQYDHNAIMMQKNNNNPMQHKMKFWEMCAREHLCPFKTPNLGNTPCVNGFAGEYPCSNADLLSFVSLASQGSGGDGNDVWGWTDPQDGREYAIACVYDGTSFIDVTEPTNPSVLGFLPTHTTGSMWRDAKVYQNHVFIVSEARGHGMQVFDLTQLRNLPRDGHQLGFHNMTKKIRTLSETAFYGEFGSAHNIVINEETGFAYSVGSQTCNSGLHMVDIRNPASPQFSGCYADDGYVHDAQCVVYDGPDTQYNGKEICFCYNEDTLTIVDVTDKSQVELISRTDYVDAQYTHQGWLLPGSKYLLLNDELDELDGVEKTTRTLLWDISSLQKPVHTSDYFATEHVIDHNLYVKGKYAYLANYCGGLRVLDTSQVSAKGLANGETPISEVAFLDVSPDCDTATFLGSWSSYPYFPSGNIIVQSIERGLFVVKVHYP